MYIYIYIYIHIFFSRIAIARAPLKHFRDKRALSPTASRRAQRRRTTGMHTGATRSSASDLRNHCPMPVYKSGAWMATFIQFTG